MFWLLIIHWCFSIVIFHLKIIFAILASVSWLSNFSIVEIFDLVLDDPHLIQYFLTLANS